MDQHVKILTSAASTGIFAHNIVVCHDYHDHSKITLRDHLLSKLVRNHAPRKEKKPTGGVAVPFPTILHLILSQAEKDGFENIISWYE